MQDLNDKVTGGTLTATEWNEVPTELQNVIEALGITLSSGDLNQLGKAIAGYVANGDFYTDSGLADAYVLSVVGSKQAPSSYTDGARIRFIAGNTNTGASTVNVAGLGVKNIKLRDGTDPTAGQIAGRILLKFDSGNDRFELVQSGMIGVEVITASGTYNPPAGVKSLEFIVTGAGGGGGGVDGQGASTAAASEGGSGGATSKLTVTDIQASYTVTVGAKGTGGAAGANDGTNGGDSSVVATGVNIVGGGGLGGTGETGTLFGAVRVGKNGGTGTGGEINTSGGASTTASVSDGARTSGSTSGFSEYGGGIPAADRATGVSSTCKGEGGGSTTTIGIATDHAGGDGGDGVVIVKEFF